jgi:hypothetical protein
VIIIKDVGEDLPDFRLQTVRPNNKARSAGSNDLAFFCGCSYQFLATRRQQRDNKTDKERSSGGSLKRGRLQWFFHEQRLRLDVVIFGQFSTDNTNPTYRRQYFAPQS